MDTNINNQKRIKSFSNLTEKQKIILCTNPHTVFETQNPENETLGQIGEIQDRFLKLPEPIKNKLVSHKTSEKIQAIGKKYNLSLLQMAPIARAIRNYYFGKIKLEKFPFIFSEEIKVDASVAQTISEMVTKEIIQNKSLEVLATPKKLTALFPLSIALQKYPKIYDQIVTKEFIQVKSSSAPARPSVRNWLYDYRQKMDGGKGDTMQRGNYIYQSENGKKLSAEEREKLSYLLKSYDENASLKIDPEEQKIIFPEFGLQKPDSKQTNVSREFNYSSQPEKPGQDNEPLTLEEKFSRSGIFGKKHTVRKSTGFNFGNFKSENYSKSKSETNLNENNRAHNQSNNLTKNIRFSSPQKFNREENEKKIEHYNPRVIKPVELKREKGSKIQGNVVDLRE